MEQWRGKVAFVTGASAGIGYDLSRKLCEVGMNVVGCARNVGKIEELSEVINKAGKSGRLIAVKCDVSQEDEVKAAFQKARDEFGGVDVCINNAGLAHNAPLLSGATSDWKNMLDVNVLGLCICTREFMTQLKERSQNCGHIFLLNSMSGHRLVSSTKNTFFYGATKFAVTALTEGIRRELRQMNSDVKVTSISPGLVRTEFAGRLGKVDDVDPQKDYGDAAVLEAEDVTSAVVYALSTPPRMQIHDVLLRPTHQTY